MEPSLLLRAFAPAEAWHNSRGVGCRQWRLLRGEQASTSSEGGGLARQEIDASHYTVEGIIGEGNYSQIYRATLKSTQQPVALKMIDKEKCKRYKKEDEILVERWVLRNCIHPAVVEMYSAFQEVGALYLALELLPGGELWAKTHRVGLPLGLARFYAAQLLEVLQFLHERDIVHRDVKPENVLLTGDGHIKVIDFGTAKLLRHPIKLQSDEAAAADEAKGMRKDRRGRFKEFVGTPEYMSPEAINNKNTDQRADLWSLGSFVAQIVTGWPPFKGGSDYLTFKRVLARKFQLPDGTPPEAASLVEALCVLDPRARLGGVWTADADATDPATISGTAPRALGGHAAVRAHPFFAPHTGLELWKAPVPELSEGEIELIDFHMKVGKAQAAAAKASATLANTAWRLALGDTPEAQQAVLDGWSDAKKRAVSLELWKLNLLDEGARDALGLGPAPPPISDEALMEEDLKSDVGASAAQYLDGAEHGDGAEDVDEDEDHEVAAAREAEEEKKIAAYAASRNVDGQKAKGESEEGVVV